MSVSEKMTAIADAIRGKTGGTEPLTLDQMATEIAGIQVGGGGVSEQEIIDAMATNSYPSGNITVLSTEIALLAFNNKSKITNISMPNVAVIGNQAFAGCTGITELYLPELIQLGQAALPNSLERIEVPKLATFVATQSIENTKIKRLVLPSFTGTLYWNALRFNRLLEFVDLNCVSSIDRSTCFEGCSVLKIVIIRTNKCVSLPNVSVFKDTPFASGGTGGTIYVPAALIEQYQQATNWSTLYAAGTCNFVAIEGSEYE